MFSGNFYFFNDRERVDFLFLDEKASWNLFPARLLPYLICCNGWAHRSKCHSPTRQNLSERPHNDVGAEEYI